MNDLYKRFKKLKKYYNSLTEKRPILLTSNKNVPAWFAARGYNDEEIRYLFTKTEIEYLRQQQLITVVQMTEDLSGQWTALINLTYNGSNYRWFSLIGIATFFIKIKPLLEKLCNWIIKLFENN